ncbi:FdhF/YdeP family oxidoreductase [Pacificimonas flava]|uniref:Putative formate dehydrogenase oxidoreductase protein n=1 Tax=Pacificimonas flava TaxID=1234595 RepID=M2TB75_9SPHN|nr:FdhF/YdeP family oxidoreductase [Pacificimonas flava]EMD83839.1 Putative formate dehydrogenase oxidoreductase protein [Pacificimonas flava]MBB5281183.1 molybdopterin-dependent oxidoreductase alpha subunit [Pacificimonas flava]
MTKNTGAPKEYHGPAGGWGSLIGLGKVALAARANPAATETLLRQNKAEGHMCTSCAWAKPAHPHPFEFCENGAKATLWDLTTDRAAADFFAEYSLAELRSWPDYELERVGRLTQPMRYDAPIDRYVPVSWDEAFRGIAAELKALDPKSVTFYTSGKAALEASYLYALFARMYGNNNLPDSSNMCHETTSVGLKKVIGSPVGTCTLEDLHHCDAIFYFGQNPGTNSPRILHPLQEAVRRGCKIIVFNPLREKGLIEFTNPQEPVQMTVGSPTDLADMYLQVRPGGDIAALMGLCKHVLARDAAARAAGEREIVDRLFIEQHCHGFDEFAQQAEETGWDEIESNSGLLRADLEAAAEVYIQAENVMGIYGMGLTQHVHGSQSIGMLVNLLLLGGNIGRQGAGITPIRGHSNVQGQRTVGITEKTKLAPMQKYRELFDFKPPQEDGHTTVEFLEALLDGSNKGFVGLGGNLARAVPDHPRVHEKWRDMALTVNIATKLNRTHLMPGKSAYLLPCLVRAEEDLQRSGPQTVTIEDSFSHIYGSIGKRRPADVHLKSELAIVAGIAKATLPAHPKWKWDEWTADYGKVRDLIAETFPDEFHDMNDRMNQPGGFYRGNAAHERMWKTDSGKAEFTAPSVMNACGVGDAPDHFHLVTLRSNDQFNTTIYGHDDRLRGLKGSRMIVLMSPADMARQGLKEGDDVTLVCDTGDDERRAVSGLTVTPYRLPDGCLAGYFPELNPLVPLWYHDKLSKTPAAKGVPVRIEV